MNKCPNCDQVTARTSDWACTWCGYPLLSNSYEEIPNTYKELNEQRLREQKLLQAKPTRDPEPIPIGPPQTILEPERVYGVERERKAQTEPTQVELNQEVPCTQTSSFGEPELSVVESHVDELYSTLEADRVAAEAKYKNKVLKVTGLVYRTVINANLDVDYVILTSTKKYGDQRVSCAFDKKHEGELRHLEEAQSVTVQGNYSGFEANILMEECSVVS